MHRTRQLAPCCGRVALELIRRAQQQRGHFQPGLGQQPRGHHAVAAVVAAAAQSTVTRRARGNCSPRKGRHRSRGRPHQLKRRHPVALAGHPVAGLHLRRGKNVHGNMVVHQGSGISRLAAAFARFLRTRSWPEMRSCAASCLHPGQRRAILLAARWCFPACRILPGCILPDRSLPVGGTPASTLLGKAKFGWLYALKNCVSKRSDTLL